MRINFLIQPFSSFFSYQTIIKYRPRLDRSSAVPDLKYTHGWYKGGNPRHHDAPAIPPAHGAVRLPQRKVPDVKLTLIYVNLGQCACSFDLAPIRITKNNDLSSRTVLFGFDRFLLNKPYLKDCPVRLG